MEAFISALYVEIDVQLAWSRWRGRPLLLAASGLICVVVARALLQVCSEARWLWFVGWCLGVLLLYRRQRSGCNKRFRVVLPLVKRVVRDLVEDSGFWFDHRWIVDCTLVPCGMSRPAVRRSDLAGWAG
jgi:hypothetical protein